MAISFAPILRDYILLSNSIFSQLHIVGSQVFSPTMNGIDFERTLVGVLAEHRRAATAAGVG